MVKRSGLVQGLFLWQKIKQLDRIATFIVFIIIRFWIVLSKLNSLSNEKKEVQEEPIAPIAPIDRLINVTVS